MPLIIRSTGSALHTAARGLLIMIGFGLVGVVLNWGVLLGLAALAGLLPGGSPATGGVGAFSVGFLVLLLGLGFPLAWFMAAQPMAAAWSARHFYQRHKDDVMGAIERALQSELGDEDAASMERWSLTIGTLQQSLEQQQPRPLRPVIRLALKQAGIPELEAAVRQGSGPLPARLAQAVAHRFEDQLAGRGTMWLWVVFAANVVAVAVVILTLR